MHLFSKYKFLILATLVIVPIIILFIIGKDINIFLRSQNPQNQELLLPNPLKTYLSVSFDPRTGMGAMIAPNNPDFINLWTKVIDVKNDTDIQVEINSSQPSFKLPNKPIIVKADKDPNKNNLIYPSEIPSGSFLVITVSKKNNEYKIEDIQIPFR